LRELGLFRLEKRRLWGGLPVLEGSLQIGKGTAVYEGGQ